jgi:hypothetical protein
MTSERRRAAIRRHHPDVGGDPELLIAALADVDGRVVVKPTMRGRLARTRRRAMRSWRRHRNSDRASTRFGQLMFTRLRRNQ